jgi:ribosomal protein L11 methyltransferase
MNYTGLYITLKADTDIEIAGDVLITELSEIGFCGFAETDSGIEAFIPTEDFKKTELPVEILENLCSAWEIRTVENQNWNQIWEENYKPVLIDGTVYIYAHFHPEIEGIRHPIKITPKMSFGTGHHATTELVIKHILNTDFNNKSVLDLGTGTGILAILAHRLGATGITATEIEDFALENCHENFAANGVSEYKLIDARVHRGSYGVYDVIIANITRNTLVSLRDEIEKSSKKGTVLIISGFYISDVDFLTDLFASAGFTGSVTVSEKESWASVKLIKE